MQLSPSELELEIMSRWLVLLLLAAIVAVEGSDVLELDEKTFEEGVNADIILVEFYAPW